MILGQIRAAPRVAPEGDWEKAKAFWFERLGYKIFAKEVADYHRSEARVRISTAPARTTKSYSTAADIFPYCMPTTPLTDSLHWIVGADYKTNKEWQYLWRWLVDRRELHGLKVEKARNNPGSGDCLIVLQHGREGNSPMRRAIVEGKSCLNPQSLQGEELTTAVMSEAKEHPQAILDRYLRTRTWKITLPTTPGANAFWIRDLIDQGRKDPAQGIESFFFPRSANPLYNHQRFQEAERQASIRTGGKPEQDPFFAEQFLGEWVFYTGRVLPFDRHRHVLEQEPLEALVGRRFLSIDYGYADACVALFWSIGASGTLYVTHEIYERRLSTPEFVERIDEVVRRNEMRIQYASPDPSKPEVSRLVREAGIPLAEINKNALRDRAAGHQRLVDVLTEGPEPDQPGLYVLSRCRKTIQEWERLHYRENVANENAVTAFVGDDHAYDAARYGVLTVPLRLGRPRPENPVQDYLRMVKRRARTRTKKHTWGLHA